MCVPFTATVQIARNEWLSFHDPVLVLRADSIAGVRQTISDVERLTRGSGFHAVGFVTYEAGAAFGLAVSAMPVNVPLACFGLFDPSGVSRVDGPKRRGDYEIGPLRATRSAADFERAFAQIKARLAAGDTYQANYTFRMEASFSGDVSSLFADLVEAQNGEYSALLELGDVVICSASPELFFEIRGADVLARPMKGTARRGRTLADDRLRAEALGGSAKERAENVMVVDMVRNDLGRVADVGTVTVPELFRLERFPTVWQMTSLVTARSQAPLEEIFAALHPSASVTGAPKVRTMKLLADLEEEPRGIYTGAIGHVPPDGQARFNVAIRTAVVDRRAGRLTFGVGSGIVWDSRAAAEYAECLLKGAVVDRRPVAFELLETLLWLPGEGYTLLSRHLDRLRDTAEYFGVPVSLTEVQNALHGAVTAESAPRRVRLLVDDSGRVRVEHRPHVPWPDPVRLRPAASPVDADDVFLYHKTTNRRVYDEARTAVGECDDVVLWNARGEITETTMANVVIEREGRRLTPPVSCGLLAGTCRASMLESGAVMEKVLRLEDLQRAEQIWVVNSVQGARRAELIGT